MKDIIIYYCLISSVIVIFHLAVRSSKDTELRLRLAYLQTITEQGFFQAIFVYVVMIISIFVVGPFALPVLMFQKIRSWILRLRK